MRAVIKPSRLQGDYIAPPSKSYAHRILICAGLSHTESTISGIAESQDMLATENCLKALGANISKENNIFKITPAKSRLLNNEAFNCNESGSTLRFFIPIALAFGGKMSFCGTERLIERGIDVYEELFSEKDISITKNKKEITFSGKLKSGSYTIPGNISSQYISGLLMALPLLGEESRITVIPPIESSPYIDITLDVMKSFGIDIIKGENNTFIIPKNQVYIGHNAQAEGDWSNSAFALCANALGSRLDISGLNENSLQGDKICTEYIACLENKDKPIDLSSCPDLAPILFALAAAKNGGTFTGTKRLRIKESDRGVAMAEELLKFGIKADIADNSITIMKGELQKPTRALSSHNDHRIVMAMTLLSTITGGTIENAEAINKSYPDFFSVLKKSGLEVEYEN